MFIYTCQAYKRIYINGSIDVIKTPTYYSSKVNFKKVKVYLRFLLSKEHSDFILALLAT
jgi:hypothetical protein